MADNAFIDLARLDQDRFVEQLRRRMAEEDLTQYDLAGRIDVSQAFVSAMLTGKKTPGRKTLAKMLEVLDLGWDDVAEPPAPKADGKHLDAEQLKRLGLSIIPHLNIEASAGDGAEVAFEETEGETVLPDWYIRQHFHVAPERVKRIRVTGNSMVPTVYPGQNVYVVMMNPGEEAVDGGIYVLRGPHGILFKRLYYDAEAGENGEGTRYYVRIHSDNPDAGVNRLPLDVFRRDYHLIAQFRLAEQEL